ncbi:MAG: hypothetical protein M3552_01430 [Planctomycetota bacterium]|nr:hypothetical protein [Planctomycetaceae bacterium]MDQ3329307.1 hypothetical protein [Planctomycetota bacterium]
MSPSHDRRLYVPHPENWAIKTKASFDREYCHAKFPGDEHYHLLVGGELHLDNGEQKYCLDCALRLEMLTADRMYWQKGRAANVLPPPDNET